MVRCASALGALLLRFASADVPGPVDLAEVQAVGLVRVRDTSIPKQRMNVLSNVLVGSAQKQPDPEGHFLTNVELSNITDVACLEARQKDPTVDCEALMILGGSARSAFSGALNAGNYPRWSDPICGGVGEYLCDPTNVLTLKQQEEIAEYLKEQRENMPVTCGDLQDDPVDPRHLQPFYLGVALAEGFPKIEQDPSTLQFFGQKLVSDWNMDRLYTGDYRPYSMCPNQAMLIIFPDAHQAFLSTQSCNFICQQRGGYEVAQSVLRGLDASPMDGIKAGIKEVYRYLGNVPAQSEEAPPSLARVDSSPYNVFMTNLLLRGLFATSVLVLVASLIVGVLVMALAPGFIGRARLDRSKLAYGSV